MTVRADPPPRPERMIAVLDEGAERTVKRAKDATTPIVEREVPRGRTGKLGKELRPRAGKTPTGFALTIRASKRTTHDRTATIAQVVRWVTRGTGVYREGPGSKSPIRAKPRWNPRAAMILPGGKRVRSIRGQKPNPFLQRIEIEVNPVIERIYREGAHETAREMERVS